MAYQLGRRERVFDGIRRIVIEELRAARKNLSESHPSNETRIHAARKSIKKVRAIVAAVDAAGGRGTTRSGKRLRDVNRVLSPLRDLDAMTKTLARLREIYPTMFSEHAFGRIRRNLLTQRQRVMESTRARGLWKEVNRKIQRLPREVRAWRSSTRGFTLLARGVRESQQEGRRLLARALVRQQAADFHAWRKQVKKLWYLLRLLEWAGYRVRRDVKALGRAEECLGDAHDMGTLCTELSMEPDLFSSDAERLRFRRAIEDLQVGLHVKAIASTKRIFRQRPQRYVRNVKSVWHEGRSQRRATTTRSHPERKLA
jgi:CHAD domain-containing protein